MHSIFEHENSHIMYFRYTASRPSGAIVLLCYQDPTLKAKVE